MTKIPLLCYAIFHFSCIFTNNRIWLWNENKEETSKVKTFTNINIQKTIIHTLVDLINTVIEANFEKDKNFLYEFNFDGSPKNFKQKLHEEAIKFIKAHEFEDRDEKREHFLKNIDDILTKIEIGIPGQSTFPTGHEMISARKGLAK